MLVYIILEVDLGILWIQELDTTSVSRLLLSHRGIALGV